MKSLGWRVEHLGQSFAFIRPFSLFGSFIKIQRINLPIYFDEIETLRQEHRAFKTQISPFISTSEKKIESEFLKHHYRVDFSPNTPTKTIQVDLRSSLDTIFSCFTESKRRATRRAIRYGISIRETDNIDSFIKIRAQKFFPFGFLMKKEIDCLWKLFYPNNAKLLLAYDSHDVPVSGILLLHFDGVSYYWHAASTSIGKKSFAPTLLVWEALKLSKTLGLHMFDFEGVYDERFSSVTSSWKGFTRFKQGFGGKEVDYAPNFCK